MSNSILSIDVYREEVMLTQKLALLNFWKKYTAVKANSNWSSTWTKFC